MWTIGYRRYWPIEAMDTVAKDTQKEIRFYTRNQIIEDGPGLAKSQEWKETK